MLIVEEGNDILKNNNLYFIINIDEHYAEEIFEILKAGEIEKGGWPEGDINFEEWKQQLRKEA